MTDLLRVEDLAVSFNVEGGQIDAVRGVSFRVPQGGTVALVGESGSGKSVISQTIMLKIFTDQVFTIGTVSGVPQPVVVSNRLHNVPEQGIYSWDPGAHFGIYKPDCFWVDSSAPTTN